MFCRLRQCRQILPKLNLSAILLLFLIKRAALGNLKANFHCAHWHSFFPLKKGLSKTHQSSLTLKGGSTAFPKPLSPQGTGDMYKPPYSVLFFSKTHQSSLTLKGGSTAFSKPFSPQGTRDVPTALLGAQTASL